MKPLHLITQRDQPYGSVRLCCERCGAWTVEAWTDDESEFRSPPDGYRRCDDSPAESE